MAEDIVPREDVSSALEARRELGPEYEDAVVDAFVEKVERRLEERLKHPVRQSNPSGLAVPLGSLALAIPLLGVAGGTAGLAGVIAVAIAIVLVNLVYAGYALRR
jgi:hypothetical protein